MKFILFLSLFIFTSQVFAGDKGNIYDGYYSGHAVVCRNTQNKIITASLLDYSEGDLLHGQAPIIFEKKYTADAFMTAMADKLQRVAPHVFSSFRHEAKKLAYHFEYFGKKGYQASDDVVFTTEKLVLVNDASYQVKTTVPGCTIEQLVIRQKKFHSVYYVIQLDIFKKLDPMNRRGLALHEAIYHSFNMYFGDMESVRTRYFHRALMQMTLQQMSDQVILKYLQRAYVYF